MSNQDKIIALAERIFASRVPKDGSMTVGSANILAQNSLGAASMFYEVVTKRYPPAPKEPAARETAVLGRAQQLDSNNQFFRMGDKVKFEYNGSQMVKTIDHIDIQYGKPVFDVWDTNLQRIVRIKPLKFYLVNVGSDDPRENARYPER